MSVRTLQRVILPEDADLDVLPLYVDTNQAALAAPDPSALAEGTVVAPAAVSTMVLHPEQIRGRRSLEVPEGQRLSFATYFNAFPASYWRRWTVVTDVTLRVAVSGDVAVIVYRSTADGRTQRVESIRHSGDRAEYTVALTLTPFADGGWYWFDLIAGRNKGVLEEASWEAEVPDDRAAAQTATIAITTFNRPDFCAKLIGQLGAATDIHHVLDEVLVIDQGTKKVREEAAFPDAEKSLGGRLRVIDQGNLGGSGGFSRGMSETLSGGRSSYVLLLDDDIVSEPEGILRAVTFADLARTRTIVGGHMFSLYSRATLHSFGETINRWRFWWGAHPLVKPGHDFGIHSLRATPWLHRRVDVDYNGWWMCLIPVETLRTVGLSLPLFIKWDDSEYGLRAGEAGFPTVSLPGAAVWHVPWTDKDDALDWQAYFHQRNRLVAALLHSPYERGGRLVRESMNHQLKHLLSMQYSVASLRLQAIQDVLSGPDHMHAGLPTKLGEIRSFRTGFADSTPSKDPAAFPLPRRRKAPRRGKEAAEPSGAIGMGKSALIGLVRQARPVRQDAEVTPEVGLAAADARWWRLASVDSAVVSTSDGTAASWYRRDRGLFEDLLRRSLDAHRKLYAEWPGLAHQYKLAVGDVTSPEAWRRTIDVTPL